MKNLIFLFGLFMALTSCQKEEMNCQEDSISGDFQTNQSIILDTSSIEAQLFFRIEDGSKIVFSINHSGAQCNDVIDDEWGEIFVFQIDSDQNSFLFIDQNIASAMGLHREWGAWIPGQAQFIMEGEIRGDKLSENVWDIDIDITLPSPNTRGETGIKYKGSVQIK